MAFIRYSPGTGSTDVHTSSGYARVARRLPIGLDGYTGMYCVKDSRLLAVCQSLGRIWCRIWIASGAKTRPERLAAIAKGRVAGETYQG